MITIIEKILIVNSLTFIRVIGTIILIPLYNILGGKIVGIISLLIYLTDIIDGLLARFWKVSTFFGSLFDGLADKLFTIINFIILYMITPYALIPIIIEILIILVQLFKFSRNLNIQSNIIGKIKVWVLAICIVLAFLTSDIQNINIISIEFKEVLINLPDKLLYLILLSPAIVIEVLTLFSYLFEISFPKNIEIFVSKPQKIKISKLKGKDKWTNFKSLWLNPEFYEKHKDDTNLRDLRKLSRKNG